MSLIVAALQARMSSSRLPGKVLMPLLGKPMICHQIDRIKRSKMIDKLVVATSTHSSDNPLAMQIQDLGVECYRGQLKNVLSRLYGATSKFKPDHVVRLTGDCPLIDPEVIDKTIEHHLQLDLDYTSNILPPSFPDGLDVEIVKFDIFKKINSFAVTKSEMEHVTLYIRNNLHKFKTGNFSSNINLSDKRWTVDNIEDFIFVEKVYEELYSNKRNFSMADVLSFVKLNPEIEKINSHYRTIENE